MDQTFPQKQNELVLKQMRKSLFFLLLLMAGCSAPRYFGHFGGQSYRFPVPTRDQVSLSANSEDASLMIASAGAEENQLTHLATVPSEASIPQVRGLTGRRAKASLQDSNGSVRFTSYNSPVFSGLDDDPKMAIILGAAGLTGLFLVVLSQIFGILGGLLLIGGVIYFTRWMLRQ